MEIISEDQFSRLEGLSQALTAGKTSPQLVQPGWRQLLREAQASAAGADLTGVDPNTRLRAQRLFTQGNSVFDTERVPEVQVFEPTAQLAGDETPYVGDIDVDRFLRKQHEQILAGALQESRETAAAACDRRLEQYLADEWVRKKREILTILGLQAAPAGSHATHSLRNEASGQYQGKIQSTSGSKVLSIPVESAPFANVVRSFVENSHVSSPATIPLLAKFETAARSALSSVAPGSDTEFWSRPWHLLRHITREGMRGHPNVRAECYGQAYHGNNVAFGAFIAGGSIGHLERLFGTIMDNVIARHPHLARRGGATDRLQDVHAYLQVRLAHWRRIPTLAESDMVIDDMPFWPQLWYCLRCGAREEALRLANSAKSALPAGFLLALQACCQIIDNVVSQPWEGTGSDVFDSSRAQASFHQIATSFITDDVVRAVENVRTEYERCCRARTGHPGKPTDPFKLAVLNILAQSDPTQHSILHVENADIAVETNFQDFLWHRLWHVATGALSHATSVHRLGSASSHAKEEGSDSGYTLQELAGEVLAYGHQHWDPEGTQPYKYFEILCLVGQFEVAIDYLARCGHTQNRHTHLQDAVHFAIALYHYGLIRVKAVDLSTPDEHGDPSGATVLLLRTPLKSEINSNTVTSRLPEDVEVDEEIASGMVVLVLDMPTLIRQYTLHKLGDNGSLSCAYALMLRGTSTVAELSLRQQMLREILCRYGVELHNYALGCISSDSYIAQAGLLQRLCEVPFFQLTDDSLMKLMRAVAISLREQNRLLDAVDVFMRGFEIGAAIDIVLEQLATNADKGINNPDRKAWKHRAQALLRSPLAQSGDSVHTIGSLRRIHTEILLRSKHLVRNEFSFEQCRRACQLEVCILDFFDCIQSEDYILAMQKMDSLQLLPSDFQGSEKFSWADTFEPLHPAIKSIYARILVTVLRAVHVIVTNARQSGQPFDTLQRWRAQAHRIARLDHSELQQLLSPEQKNEISKLEMSI